MNDKEFSKILEKLPRNLVCEIEENNQRKNYSILERAQFQEALRKLLQKEFNPGRKTVAKNHENCQQIGTLKSLGVDRVDDLIGKMTGQSKETVRKNRIIYEAHNKNPEKIGKLIDKADKGIASYTMLYRIAQRSERPPPELLPKGEYSVISADPPWQYSLSQNGAAEDQYPTMPTQEICKMGSELPAAKDSVLFLWATIPKLKDALEVINTWDYEYKTAIVWEKEKDGQIQNNGIGYWVNSSAELLLIGVKGKPGLPETRFPGVIRAPRRRHSQKPEIIYELIEKAYPKRSYLELFARHPTPRPGWTYWGNETNKIPEDGQI